MIDIRRFESGLLSSNMYVVVEGDHAIVIDPFDDTSPADNLSVERIILTHEHYDHISGVNEWKKKTGAPVLCSLACAENIISPRMNLASHFRDFCELQTWLALEEVPTSDPEYVCTADETFEDKFFFEWQGHRWDLFELPGHSRGSIGILLDRQYFFSGDSLIENNKIELRLPGGSRKKWKEIGYPRIEEISDGIRVFPGHFGDFIYKKEG